MPTKITHMIYKYYMCYIAFPPSSLLLNKTPGSSSFLLRKSRPSVRSCWLRFTPPQHQCSHEAQQLFFYGFQVAPNESFFIGTLIYKYYMCYIAFPPSSLLLNKTPGSSSFLLRKSRPSVRSCWLRFTPPQHQCSHEAQQLFFYGFQVAPNESFFIGTLWCTSNIFS
jgi:hypothetical protein